ncbi:MAG TPA: TolC family protein [Candidatus Limnocylindria bacterium]|jgi:outer membrane protein TolC|nr:TolC family protein [Candidatus Limnocylindria bacterium]
MKWAVSIGFVALALAGCAHFDPQEIAPVRSATALQERSLGSAELLEFVHDHLPAAPLAWPPKSWDLEMLTLVGLYYHPSLDVARAQWAVARGGSVTASARPNPILGVTPGYNFSSASSGPGAVASPWLPSVTLDLPIETAGKRGYRQARAVAVSRSARFTLFQVAWQVRSAIRMSLLEIAYSDARAKALENQVQIEAQLTETIGQRLAAGAVSSLEASQRRVAADKAQIDLTEAHRLAGNARIKLAENLGMPASGLTGINLDFPTELAPRAPLEPAVRQLRDTALTGRSDVLAALADFEASQAALQLEIARQYPDIHLGNGYQYDQGDHKWTLGITLELPVLNQNQGPIAEARARREEAAARFTAVQAHALALLDQAVANNDLAGTSWERAQQLKDSQTVATQTVETSFAGGGADKLDLLLARLELGAGQLSWLEAAYRAQLAAGQLEDAVQQPFAGQATVETPRRRNK